MIHSLFLEIRSVLLNILLVKWNYNSEFVRKENDRPWKIRTNIQEHGHLPSSLILAILALNIVVINKFSHSIDSLSFNFTFNPFISNHVSYSHPYCRVQQYILCKDINQSINQTNIQLIESIYKSKTTTFWLCPFPSWHSHPPSSQSFRP